MEPPFLPPVGHCRSMSTKTTTCVKLMCHVLATDLRLRARALRRCTNTDLILAGGILEAAQTQIPSTTMAVYIYNASASLAITHL